MFLIDTTSALLGAMFLTGFWSISFSTVFIIVAILLVASEEFSWAYTSMVVYAVLLAIFTPANVFVYVWHEPLHAIGFVLMFFVIGAIYSALKYGSFLRRVVNMVKDAKQAFIIEHKLKITTTEEIPEEYASEWQRFKSDKLEYSVLNKINRGLRPSDNKALIMNWIAFWPFSAIGLFVADPLREIVKSIYQHMVSIYGKMYEHIISKSINMSDISEK